MYRSYVSMWLVRTSRHRGGMYVVVLGTVVAVTVIGVASLTALRIERRWSTGSADFTQARLCAQSAIELGMLDMREDATWRTTRSSGVWFADRPLGLGSYTLQGVDPGDNDLADSPSDSVILTGIGRAGAAQYSLAVMMVHSEPALEALRTGVHSNGQFSIQTGRSLTVSNGPASTNSVLSLQPAAVLTGSAEVDSVANSGTISGSVTTGLAAKPMPDAGVFAHYRGLASTMVLPGDVVNRAIGPGVNPFGATQVDGVYYIDSSSRDLIIRDSRIVGTLVINAPGRTVTISEAVHIQPSRADYPTLIVNGNLTLSHQSTSKSLSEVSLAVNLNPLGVKYQGLVDVDLLDVYPNQIEGLVHTKGDLVMTDTAKVSGAVIVEGKAQFNGTNEIAYDPSLYANPPFKYTNPPEMVVAPGSWQQLVN